MLKVLMLGNSFSQDCSTYLERIAPGAYVRNLYIGGCTLERHAENLREERPCYTLQKDGAATGGGQVSANEIICSTDWDVVTVQQQSIRAGLKESIEPHLGEILAYVRAHCPHAKILWLQTWAYAKDARIPAFGAVYHWDQINMSAGIEALSHRIAAENGLGLIEVGRAIRLLRERLEPDGTDFCRDGYHLSYQYGRYAGAYTVAKRLGLWINDVCPVGADAARIGEIRRVLDTFF